ncbi:unnamed protein product [Orchesella dallaii]|uniref:Glucose-methanol-choline oxidoreductase N-terminal domain-containing protein n=1 Tax=Orchesella dallaii TaxID=48710 RepID=A0ABP1RLP9_9HEXA
MEQHSITNLETREQQPVLPQLASVVFGSIPILISLYATKYLEEDKKRTLDELERDLNLPRITNYDFIVVGSGSAGSVIASRLSEEYSVLLLEAGGQPVPASQVPHFIEYVESDPGTNYFWPSLPQRHASQDTGGIIICHLGKMLGGSGSHNDMRHIREVQKTMIITLVSSTTLAGAIPVCSNNYGHNGLITVDTDTPPILPIWFDLAGELGFPIADPNGHQTESFTPLCKAMKRGQRSSSYNEMIKPYMNSRENLTVHQYSVATQRQKAYGILYERHGIPQIAHASKEIVISSGIFSSPLLLMKSGVGPRDQLEEAGIPVKHELPSVGQNLGDHLMFTLRNIQYNDSIKPFIPTMPEEMEFEKMLKSYHENGEGFISNPIVGPQAFVVSSRAMQDGEGDWPDFQVVFHPSCPNRDDDDANSSKINSCIHLFLTRTKSRGSLRLNTTVYKHDGV